MDKAGQYAYRDRSQQEANFPRSVDPAHQRRCLREHGLTYGRFIDGLSKAEIAVDRKVLSDLAITDAGGLRGAREAGQGRAAEGGVRKEKWGLGTRDLGLGRSGY